MVNDGWARGVFVSIGFSLAVGNDKLFSLLCLVKKMKDTKVVNSTL